MAEPIFKLINVTKIYGKHTVLDNVSLEVKRGEILGLIGPSGSGKTTLLNVLIGFIKPEGGDVLFRIEHKGKNERGATYCSVFHKFGIVKNIYGFASQMPSFYDNLTVQENLEYFACLYNLTKEAAKANIKSLLEFLELSRAKKLMAKKLSGGMERRLDIACALIHDPDVLILDEPTGDLDPLLSNSLLELIKKINKKGTTIIIASHNLNEIERICHRVAILEDRSIVDVASPEDLKHRFATKDEIHIESYPGNYAEMIDRLKSDKKASFENRGNELVILTPNPNNTLHEIFHVIEQLKESIIDLRVNKPSLQDIFIDLTEKKKREENVRIATEEQKIKDKKDSKKKKKEK